MDGKIDVSNIRVHFAARAIAYYVSRGEHKYFIRPLTDSSIFDYYFESIDRYTDIPAVPKQHVISGCLRKWPKDKLDNFLPYPVLQLIRRHKTTERYKILLILEQQHGFQWTI